MVDRLHYCLAKTLPSLSVLDQSILLHAIDFGLVHRSYFEQRNGHMAILNRGSSGTVLGGICVSASPGAPAIHHEMSMPQIATVPSAWVPDWEISGSDLNLTCSLKLSPADRQTHVQEINVPYCKPLRYTYLTSALPAFKQDLSILLPTSVLIHPMLPFPTAVALLQASSISSLDSLKSFYWFPSSHSTLSPLA